MSHYTVKFTGTRAEKEAQALRECKQWMGSRWNKFVRLARTGITGSRTDKLRGLYFGAGMNGMQGRVVVHALYRHLWPK